MLNTSASLAPMHSLQRLGQILKENPDTGTGVQIRAMLWSLLNQHHLVNLWTMCSRLNGEPAELAANVLTAALMGRLTDTQVKKTLRDCGELDRWNRSQQIFEETLQKPRRFLEHAIRTTPASEAHVRLVMALRAIENR
jgi:hypothetical protein